MIVGEAIYSYGNKYTPYNLAYKQLGKEKLSNIDSVLVLGAGLGSCVKILESKYPHPSRYYDIVDIDEIILSLCEQFLREDFANIDASFYHSDAFDIMNDIDQEYDLICVDLFIELSIPKFILKNNFLEKCKQNLSREGVIIFNTLIKSKMDQLAFEELLKKIFSKFQRINYRLNYIYIVHI